MSTSERDETTVWPELPTETEIYIMPGGRIVIADLPAELSASIAELGQLESEILATEELGLPHTSPAVHDGTTETVERNQTKNG